MNSPPEVPLESSHGDSRALKKSLAFAEMRRHGRGLTGTFRPKDATALPEQWRRWLDHDFAGLIAPIFREAYDGVIAYRSEDVLAADARLHEALSSRQRSVSIELRQRMVGGLPDARECRVLRRFTREAEAGTLAGHLPIFFAARAAVLNIALRQALLGYAWAEWDLAHQALGVDRPWTKFLAHGEFLQAAIQNSLVNQDSQWGSAEGSLP
ncbi:MAG: urease accessory UreF family protein [Verrucomicrobiota bacterium]